MRMPTGGVVPKLLNDHRRALLKSCAIVTILAGATLAPRPAAAQFVCVGNATGATVPPATADGASANAAGAPNVACGNAANASGTNSLNSAIGVGANASGNT